MAESRGSLLSRQQLAEWRCPFVSDFDDEMPDEHSQLLKHLEAEERKFISWVANIRRKQPPVFLPGIHFVSALVASVRSFPYFAGTTFHIYIDEYENLRESQQRIVNTALKHSTPSLVFNIAIKRYGIRTTATLGTEVLSTPDDYRVFDIDEEVKAGFDLFAAEVFFFRMTADGRQWGAGAVDAKVLQSPESLDYRRAEKYRRSVLLKISEMFPAMSHSQIAAEVVSTPSLLSRIEERLLRLVDPALHGELRQLICEAPPEAVVILPALLSRPRLATAFVLRELRKEVAGSPSEFRSGKSWIHNNLYAAILQVYTPHNRVCPLYAGFETFVLMSHNNLRHFIELCHLSLNKVAPNPTDPVVPIPVEMQALCARDASSAFVREIRSFGELGTRMHSFVRTLGGLFAKLLARPTLSEPEVSQLAIRQDDARQPLPEDIQVFVTEAVKWSVLIEVAESKMKDVDAIKGLEWQLSPIYAPAFHISPRKKRKLELSVSEFAGLVRGQAETVNQILGVEEERQRSSSQSYARTLFDEAEEEDEDGAQRGGA